jgi:predicted PurR-regulated permease PerM
MADLGVPVRQIFRLDRHHGVARAPAGGSPRSWARAAGLIRETRQGSMADIKDSGDFTARGEDCHPETRNAAFVDLAIRLTLLGVLAYWSLLLIRPFLTIILWSIVLAVALYPVYEWLADRLGGRRVLAAILLTAMNLAIVFGPVTWLSLGLVDNLRTLSERFIAGSLSIPPPFEAVKTWPLIGERAFEIWSHASSNLAAAFAKIAPQLKPIGGILLGIAATGGIGMLKFVASVIVADFLFVPGPSLIAGVKTLSDRVDSKHGAIFIQLSGAAIRSVSRGVIGISLLQALLAGIGLMAAGVPFAGLITFAVLLLGIIQIGPTVILVPVILWSWIVMDTMTALAFTAYMLPVNLLDNVLRPIILARGMSTPMPVLLVGMIGGTIVHGIIGIFVGPIVLAIAWDLIVAWGGGGKGLLSAAAGRGTL